MPGWIVWDSRNGNVTPAIGLGDNASECIYTEENAIKAAVQLNCYVLRNTNPAMAALVASGKAELKGPFYVHPVAKRGMLEGRAGTITAMSKSVRMVRLRVERQM